jgi:hypothetical protein
VHSCFCRRIQLRLEMSSVVGQSMWISDVAKTTEHPRVHCNSWHGLLAAHGTKQNSVRPYRACERHESTACTSAPTFSEESLVLIRPQHTPSRTRCFHAHPVQRLTQQTLTHKLARRDDAIQPTLALYVLHQGMVDGDCNTQKRTCPTLPRQQRRSSRRQQPTEVKVGWWCGWRRLQTLKPR